MYKRQGFGKGGFDEQGVGHHANVGTHAAQLDSHALALIQALVLAQRGQDAGQFGRAKGTLFHELSLRTRRFFHLGV